MIAYEKKNSKARKRFMMSLGLLSVLVCGVMLYPILDKKEEIPVFNDFGVLQLPPIETKVDEKVKEKIILPYKSGKKVVDYFDGEKSDVISIVEFEGVFRPSLGVDITNNGASFEVYSAMDGDVIDVNNDQLLGNGIRIQSDDIIITYQSLDQITLKKGDKVKQGDCIGNASTNIYQSSLSNHLHLVVEKAGVRMNPNQIFKFE